MFSPRPGPIAAALLAAPLLMLQPGAALAQAPAQEMTLRVGMEGGPTSLDPHYASIITNIAYSRHVFQPLVQQDHRQQLRPAIATAWRAVNELTWEFRLDPAARFHDGSPVTAEDVAFTLRRAGDVPNSPSSFRVYTRPIAAVEAVDATTILIRTTAPTPLLPNYLSLVMIVSKAQGEAAATADYNSGRAMIGTGPYRHVSWQPGSPLVLQRNEDFAGPKPDFARVEFRPIANAGARVAALSAGDVDLIEIVPPDQFRRLGADARFATAESPSNRLLFLTLDSDRVDSPHVRARDGGPIANPLRDPRVRRALSIAINRDALVQRVLQGQGVPAGDLGPAGYFGTSPDLTPPPYDLDGAKRLLAEAGYPQGFAVQVNGPNDRFVNDEQVVQAIAQMWTRLGLVASVETRPRGVWLAEAAQLKYSVNLAGFSPNPEVLGMLETQIHSWNPALGLGTANRGRFSNTDLDGLIQKARQTMDDAERAALTQQATRAALRDQTALIPLYFQVNTWAMRRGLTYEARADEMTLAMSARRAP
ncbi:ABC transporter substrate-binding protein [Pseudoroseomonas cervicalis]|uniref:ABC transporter substrate-binding protein n=1 Tax=Teichococcus cervicalis TaxID=204525 RepID=UPI0022F152E9|nr:ABC transporter substrate-binding protein [Pseudoroseomonas cervicalis]WBV41766.1 ABC transporter substrate-binding protein [Pseudoroseomonas cervicalis]